MYPGWLSDPKRCPSIRTPEKNPHGRYRADLRYFSAGRAYRLERAYFFRTQVFGTRIFDIVSGESRNTRGLTTLFGEGFFIPVFGTRTGVTNVESSFHITRTAQAFGTRILDSILGSETGLV